MAQHPPARAFLALSWCAMAVLAAILFGGNGLLTAPALCLAALFLTAITLTTTPSRQKWPLFPLAAIGAVLAWGAVQTLPLPALANPLWGQASAALGQQLPQSISVNTQGTHQALAQGTAYLGTFIAAWLLAQRARTASLMLKLLALSGVAIAAMGLAMFAAGNDFIWNLPKRYYADNLSATFINRNTYATFAGLTVLLNLAVALERWGELPSSRRSGWRERAHALLNLVLLPRWGYFAGAGLGLVALMLTHSRAGIACALLGVVVMVACLFLRRQTSWAATITVGALLAAGFLTTFGMLGEATNQRFNHAAKDSTERGTLYAITTQAIYAAPYTGSGLGTFEETFRAARTPQLSLGINTRVDHAHNTWLQLALELGLPAFALLLATVGWVLAQLLKGFNERRRGITYPALGLGAAALLGTHALVDFSLQIPGLAYTAMLLLGLALAQSERKTTEDSPTSNLPGMLLALPVLAAMVVVAPALWAAWQTAPAQHTLLAAQRRQPIEISQLLEARSQLLPYANRYANELALADSILTERAKPNPIGTLGHRMGTLQYATLGLSKAPANPYAWHRLASARLQLGDPKGAATAMAASLLTGPFEPNLVWQRLPLLAILRPHMTSDDQTFANSLMHQLWSSQPQRTWRTIRNRPPLVTMVATAIAHDAEAVKTWEKVTRKPFPLAQPQSW